ncbi:MAG: hypothetical protein RL215_2647 [Planctomycetota bacterium]
MKFAVRTAFCAFALSFMQVGCGTPTYDIPEVDAAESKAKADEISKQMELQMKSGGKASPEGPAPGQITN